MDEKDLLIKRICEDGGHPEVELEPFEECPFCKSKAYHKVVKFIDGRWI